MKKGFTLIEILIAISIVAILSVITVNMLNSERQTKQLGIIADDIVSKLEEAKTNSQSGKNGQNYGIKFNSDSYIYFEGSSFDPNDSQNKVFNLDSNFIIIENITNSDNVIIFSKIKGDVGFYSVIKVAKQNDVNKFVSILIGELGDVSVVK